MQDRQRDGGGDAKQPRAWLVLIAVALLVALALQLGGREWAGPTPTEISYTEFKNLVAEGQVAEVVVREHAVYATLLTEYETGDPGGPTKHVTTRIPSFGETDILPQLEQKGVTIRAEEPREEGFGWFWFLLPWVVILGLYFLFWRRMAQGFGGTAGGFGGLGQSRVRTVTPDMPATTFDDVAGQDSAKRDVIELVDFLREPSRYQRLGAEAPHGLLLVGPPGTGKTLMARALAGEAKVPFLHISGSEFIEMVVGVGAARVRNTFEQAKKQQPSILFIDEIDAIGRVRGAGMGGGHDEREQTLNQILDEMDGFRGHEAVIVVAATNRPDVLDPALLRPGRFDRRITLDLPDRSAREHILKVHAAKVPMTDSVDLGLIAAGTPGFSGADLKNLINEAALLAGREKARRVEPRHFDEARDKVLMGAERPIEIHPEERHRLAVHECGHTAVAHYLRHADPLYKVTIIPRGQALGGTHQLPESERYTMPEDYLRDRLAVTLAGRTSEQILCGNVSSGADDDIRQATRLARAMVARWGMDEDVGPVDLRASDENPFLGLEMAKQRTFSDTTAHKVDEAVKRLLAEAQDRAAEVIRRHRRRIERLVQFLEERETLGREEIEDCLGETRLAREPEASAETA